MMRMKMTDPHLQFLFFLRLTRWMTDEEERIKSSGETSLQYIILDFSGKYFNEYLKLGTEPTTSLFISYTELEF